MSSGRSWSGAGGLAFAAIVLWRLAASAQGGAGPQAVYVVAVKDSGVLTMCPALREATMANGRKWKSDGRANVVPFSDDQQLLRFPPRESPLDLRADLRLRTELGATQTILPIPLTAVGEAIPPPISAGSELGRNIMAIDPALRQTVERELAKLGTHEVADSLEEADVALLVEGTYIALAAAISSDAGSIPSDVRQGAPPLGMSAQAGDWQRNLLQSVLAIAVPIGAYRASPGDVRTLLSARIWEGSEVYQPPYRISEYSRTTGVRRWEMRLAWESASLEALVWQFAGKKPRPASHPPLCAASSQAFQVPTITSSVARVPVLPVAGTKAPAAGDFGSAGAFVTLPVSVTDREGRAIVDLDPSRFRIYEDETLQVIDRVDRPGASVNVTLLIDTSSSMRRKADETHAATLTAVSAFRRIGAPVIVSFDRRVVLHSTAPDVRDRQRPGINQPSPAVGRTATRLYDAIDLLLTGALKAPSARAALVILTDGVDTASRLADAVIARRRVGESTIPVYVVHYDTSQDTAPLPPGGGVTLFVNGERPDLKYTLLPEDAADPGPVYMRAAEFVRQITDISAGRLYAAPALDDLEKTFAEIATELSQQYTLTYYPTNQTRNSTYRRIRVEAGRPDVRVRTRAGYYQAPASDELSKKR